MEGGAEEGEWQEGKRRGRSGRNGGRGERRKRRKGEQRGESSTMGEGSTREEGEKAHGRWRKGPSAASTLELIDGDVPPVARILSARALRMLEQRSRQQKLAAENEEARRRAKRESQRA